MALVTKRAGAPAGTIKASVGGNVYTFDDAANLQVDVLIAADYSALIAHPYFQAVGGSGVVTPTLTAQPVVVMIDGSEAAGSVPTLQGDGSMRLKPPGIGYVANSTDPFRFDASRLGQLRSALSTRTTRPVNYLFIGDSVTEGTTSGGTATPQTRWQGIFMAAQRGHFPTAGASGGLGYIPSAYIAGTMANFVTFSGTTLASTVNAFGLGGRHRRMAAAATATVAVPAGHTGVDLVFAVGTVATTYHYTVDGGASLGPVNTANASYARSGGSITPIRGLDPGVSHTIVVTADSNFVYFEGVMLYNGDEAKGLRGWDAGHSGYRSLDFVQADPDYPTPGVSNWQFAEYSPVQADFVSIALGLNDIGISTVGARIPPANYGRYLRGLVQGVRSAAAGAQPSIVLWEPYVRTDAWATGAGGVPVARYSDYVNEVRKVARDDGNIALFDSNAAGIALGPDGLHPTVAGHATAGNALDALVMSA